MFSQVKGSNLQHPTCADGRHDLYMWSTRPAKTCVTTNKSNSIGATTLRPGTPRVGSMVHQQVSLPVKTSEEVCPHVYIFGGSTPPRVHVEYSQPAKTPA